MTGNAGISLLNSSNVRIEDLEILSADSNANLVVLSNAGDLSADNLLLSQGNSASTVCLQPNLDWLVPVISLILS